jgi:hypothetical protein
MARSFSANSLVRLPRLSARSAARLLQELLVAASDEKKLPAAIAADRDEMKAAHAELSAELNKRLAGEGEEPPQVRAADSVEDNAFGALFDWLSAWARLPGAPMAGEVEAILQAVFPRGLAFLAIRPSDEWQEAELRLNLLKEKGFDTTIVKLGGKPFLDELERAHKAYGEALGITTVKTSPEAPALREARDAALDAVREYVLRVTAHVRKKDPQTTALAERLLAPLSVWKDRAARASGQPAAPDATPSAEPSPPKG